MVDRVGIVPGKEEDITPKDSGRSCFAAGATGLCLAATVAGCLWVTVLSADAAPDESSIVPLGSGRATQPWGTDQLAGNGPYVLSDPWSAAYGIVSGEVLLPAAKAALKLGPFSIVLDRDRATATVAAGRGRRGPREQVSAAAEGQPRWIPFRVARFGRHLSAKVGDRELVAAVPLPDPVNAPLTLDLLNSARASNVEVVTLPSDMAVLPLGPCAPDLPEAERSATACPEFDRDTLPPGLATVDGVPFLVGERPLDLQYAMKGADFSRRVKRGYFDVPPGPKRPIAAAAGRSFSALHVLAYSRRMPGHDPRMTVCYGLCTGWTGAMEEEAIEAPDFETGGGSLFVVSRVPLRLAGGERGWMYHLRLPTVRSAEFWFRDEVEFEFTRDKADLHNLPSPNEFARVPVGLPSSVVVLAATAERSPIEFAYVPDEPGNVFEEPQEPLLHVDLMNRMDVPFTGRMYARSEGPGTSLERNVQRSAWTVEKSVTLAPRERRRVTLHVMPPDRRRRGWFELEIGLERARQPLQVYRTTYAVLAPDTRAAMEGSPFGVWAFWWPHAALAMPDRHDRDIADLINKGGWRWTYGGRADGRGHTEALTPEELLDRYKITYTIRGLPESYQRGTGWWDGEEFEERVGARVRTFAENPRRGEDRVYKVLHESRSSGALLHRFSEYFGGEPYAMPEAEKRQIDAQLANVVSYCRAIKETDPLARICLINDYPSVGIEYMKRGVPKDAFDVFGTEGANFMREPERQPDWLCLLGVLHQWKRAREEFGYLDKPLWTTEALYHGTNPGNLSLHAQAVIHVREAMLALANGVERMCAAGCLRDCTDDYRWSNWGSAGFCFREPEMNPKPSYAMYAWLTQVLDGAVCVGKLAHDSTSLHVLDFARPDGTHVYPAWCVRGMQEVSFAIDGDRPAVFDAYGNPVAAPLREGRLVLTVCDTPVYVCGIEVKGVTGRKPLEVHADAGNVLTEFDEPRRFRVADGSNPVLEGSWDYPRLKGAFAVDFTSEDGCSVVRFELLEDADSRDLLQRYAELVLDPPVVLPEPARAFAVRVKGNGGWGRIMFELIDAEGRVWTSCGNQYAGASNAGDTRGVSYISFDGWQTMTIPLPGKYPAHDLTAYRPSTSDWWPENAPRAEYGIAPFTYPAEVTRVIVAMPQSILYVDEEIPLTNRVVCVDRLEGVRDR